MSDLAPSAILAAVLTAPRVEFSEGGSRSARASGLIHTLKESPPLIYGAARGINSQIKKRGGPSK